MPDQHYIVEVKVGHGPIVASMDVVAASPQEAKMIAGSQIRMQVKKGYGKIEAKKATDSGIPDFKKPIPEKQ